MAGGCKPEPGKDGGCNDADYDADDEARPPRWGGGGRLAVHPSPTNLEPWAKLRFRWHEPLPSALRCLCPDRDRPRLLDAGLGAAPCAGQGLGGESLRCIASRTTGKEGRWLSEPPVLPLVPMPMPSHVCRLEPGPPVAFSGTDRAEARRGRKRGREDGEIACSILWTTLCCAALQMQLQPAGFMERGERVRKWWGIRRVSNPIPGISISLYSVSKAESGDAGSLACTR